MFIPSLDFQQKFEFWNSTKIIEKEGKKKEKSHIADNAFTRGIIPSLPEIFPGIRVCNPLNVNVSSVKFRRIN